MTIEYGEPSGMEMCRFGIDVLLTPTKNVVLGITLIVANLFQWPFYSKLKLECCLNFISGDKI